MIAVGTLLICVLQVTLVAAFGILLSLILRRSLKASAGLPLIATLVSITVLTVCCFNSWPSWLHPSSIAERPTTDALGTHADVPIPIDPFSNQERSSMDHKDGRRSNSLALADAIALIDDMSTTNVGLENGKPNQWTLAQVMGLFFVLSLFVGVVRLLGGLIGVQLFVRSSRPLANRQLLEQVELIQAELSYAKTIAVRESKSLSLAATVGWRRPVILLSDRWREWSETQLRSILAHEIAHIRRGDFLATIFAQISLLLHFYHPLIHWLANRLRLEQELAADALAAKIVGGSRVYLDAIGELALNNSSESVGWPAHSFLPTRRTFLRRIEMLRDLKFLAGEGPVPLRWATSICIVAVTLVAVGLRPPGTELSTKLSAQTPATPQASSAIAIANAKVTPLQAKFVPEDATSVVVIRGKDVHRAFERMIATKLLKSVEQYESLKDTLQVTMVVVPCNGQPPQPASVATFTSKEARDKALIKAIPPVAVMQKAKLLHHDYEVSQDGRIAIYLPDDLTILTGAHQVVQKMILTNGRSLSPLTQSENWLKASQSAAVASISVDALKSIPVGEGAISALWESATNHTLQLDIDDRLRFKLTSLCKDQSDTQKIEASMKAGIELLKTLLDNFKKSPDARFVDTANTLAALLATRKIETSGKECRVELAVGLDDLAKLMAEPLAATQFANDRMNQTNKMKKVVIGLQNYHGAYGRFPPAVVVDADSGMKRSWRVEILPMLEGDLELYNQYRKNEPWDSPANLKVLAQMPAVFRHPTQPNDSTMTAVTAAYGEGLLFNPSSKGSRMTDVIDGLSGTIAILEAKTDIPWTKPQDIEIDVGKDILPEFGGFDSAGYTVAFADGTVRYFAKTLDIGVFKKLLTIADGATTSK